MSKSPKHPAKPAPDIPFEQAMQEVEEIIQRIERGEIGLEQSIAEYERGVQLIHRCRQIHKNAQQRVDELTQRLLDATGDGQAEAPEEPAK